MLTGATLHVSAKHEETIMKATSSGQPANGRGRLISVLLAEDDALVRSWVRLCLRRTGFRVAAEAASGAEAVELAGRRAVDVLLVGYRLPDRPGTEVVSELRRSGSEAPALLMATETQRNLDDGIEDASEYGPVVTKGNTDELLKALENLRHTIHGRPPRQAGRPAARTALSPRERQVLTLVAAGRTNREISEILGVGEETVKTLLGRTFVKLGARRRAEAVAAAYANGLL